MSRLNLSAAAMLIATMALAAGCGDTGSGNSDTKGSDAGPGVATATERLEAYSTTPAELPVTEPLTVQPTGKQLYFLQCGVPVCKAIGDGIREAGETLGFEVTTVDLGTTPESIGRGWTTAVDARPDVVISSANPVSFYESQLAELESQGVPYIAFSIPDDVGAGVTANLITKEEYAQHGRLMADFVIADSEGRGNVEFFNVPDFPVLASLQEGFKSEMEELCPDCKVEYVEVAPGDIGTALPGTVVSALQRNPDASYLAMGFGDMFSGVPEALGAVGLEDQVQGVSAAGTAYNYELIKKGDLQAADVALPTNFLGWYTVDTAARALSGQPLPEFVEGEFQTPTQVLTEDDITFDIDEGWPGVTDYKAKFEELWGLKP